MSPDVNVKLRLASAPYCACGVMEGGEGGGVFLVILGNLNCQCSSCVPQMCNVTPENKLLFPSNRQYSILLCEIFPLIN